MGQALQNFVETIIIYGIPHQVAVQSASIAEAQQRVAEIMAAPIVKAMGGTHDAAIVTAKGPTAVPVAPILDPVVHGH